MIHNPLLSEACLHNYAENTHRIGVKAMMKEAEILNKRFTNEIPQCPSLAIHQHYVPRMGLSVRSSGIVARRGNGKGK